MSKLFMLFSMIIITGLSFAQTQNELKGTIVNEHNEPLKETAVLLYPLNKGTISGTYGDIAFINLNKGIYVVEISHVGYKTLFDTIAIDGKNSFRFKLEVSALSLQEVVVSDHYAELRKKEEALNMEIVNDDYVRQNMGGSLMGSLERLPGVSTIDIGSGQSKPLIRGLGFNRVVVVENNIKHEAQQWGADHGLEIDQYAVDYIEVIKGPASLMYGSDAIGGVINMKRRKTPAKGSYGGNVDITGRSNNDFLGSSVSVYGRKNCLYADFRATILDYGDYKVPTDYVDIYSYPAKLDYNHLRNTAGKEHNLHLNLGIIKEHFQSKFYLSNISSKSGFFANTHGLEPRNVNTGLHDKSNRDIQHPYQMVKHFKAVNNTFLSWDDLKIEIDLGFQRNYREEKSEYIQHGYMPASFPETLNFEAELERKFEKYVYSGNVKADFEVSERSEVNAGLSSEFQNNQIDGRGFIIPAYRQFNLGAFVLARHKFSDKSLIVAGIRYDFGQIASSEYFDWFPSLLIENNDSTWQHLQRAPNLNRNFSSVSWSLGYNYNPGKWSYKFNVGKSFRMPIAKELAANGVNYHRFSYEVGDADLSPEISYQLDASIEFNTKRFAVGITPFFNYFSNYIYLNPTSKHDRLYGNGNQIFNYTESEVLRYGTELHAHYELTKTLQMGVIGEYVYSEQLSGLKKGFTLPFSPAPSGILNIKYRKQKLMFIEKAFLSLDYRVTAAQNNVVPPEVKTKGYQLINLGLGGDLYFGHQQVNINAQVQNLFNTKYFNHTSYYRLINVPEAGRNFIVNISIPFSGKLKQNRIL